jgi:hypothetical protein
VVVPLVAGTVLFGFDLLSDDGVPAGSSDATSAANRTPAPEGSQGVDGGSGGAEDEATPEESQSPVPHEGPSAGVAQSSAPPSAASDQDNPTPDRDEAARSGAVPAVTELSAAEAKQALADAGFTNAVFRGEQQRLFDRWYADCEVYEQDPPAGEQHAYADQVTVTYSYVGSDGSHCGA